jgi:hypothetical protein
MSQPYPGSNLSANLVWDANLGQWVKMEKAAAGATSIADGSDVAEGSTTDAAVVGDNPGTISAKLRGMVQILNDVWNSVTQRLRVDTGLSQPLTDAQLRASDVPVSTALDGAVDTHQGEAVVNTHDTDLDTGSAMVQILGSAGVPLSQNEIDFENIGLNGLFIRDLDEQTIFGTQRLITPAGRLMVEDGYQEQIVQGILRTAVAQTEVMFDCTGFNSLAVQIVPGQGSAWTGTVTFEVSLDGQTWYSIVYHSTGIVSPVATTTVSGIFRFNVAGFSKFRARTSTAGTLTAIVLAKLSTAPGVAAITTSVAGSQASALSQKATSLELNTYDTNIATAVGPVIGQAKDALQVAENWNANATYQIGDTFMWLGQMYRCILTTTAITPIPLPTNTTYFVVDQRQSKSLVTKQYVSSPDVPRIRVEIDLDAYQYRCMEETMLATEVDFAQQLNASDQVSNIEQYGSSEFCRGKSYALGGSGSSFYGLAELR